ncbi:hypothetical protein PFISCL1PPCAC_14193, partial [Pristionchus fissidentatus]
KRLSTSATMSTFKCTLVLLLCLIAYMTPMIAAQCPSANNARCSVWVKGGFCGSTFYTTLYKQATCGNECGMCDGATPTI